MALIYAKTEAGRQEIEDRGRRLPLALRSILLMVDGSRNEDELRQMGQNLRAPDDAVAQLAEMGLIEVVGGKPAAAPVVPATATIANDPDRYRELYDWMSESVRRNLGLKGYFLQLKIERAQTAIELEKLWPDVADAFARAKSHAFASRWLEETRQRVLQYA
jgi:hypothetical protein